MTHPSTLLSVATFLAIAVASQMTGEAAIEPPVPMFPVPDRIVTTVLPEAPIAAQDLASLEPI
jgi:hypothetical protein